MNRMDNIISNLSIRIFQGFCVRHDSTWQEHKTKLDYTLWSIQEGTVIISIHGNQYIAEKGEAVLFFPGNEYSASTTCDGCDFVVVHFSLEMGNGIDLFSDLNLSGIIKNIPKASYTFCKNFVPNHALAQRTSLEQYMVFLNYIYEIIRIQKSAHAISFADFPHKASKPIIQEAIDFISLNYCHVTVQQVAKHVHVNEKRFITNFKNIVGLSPGQYISQCKMRKAAELLITTDLKVTEIAGQLGFADQYSFSKAFKRTFREAPTIFRKNTLI